MNKSVTIFFAGFIFLATTLQVQASNSHSPAETDTSSFSTISPSQLFDQIIDNNNEELLRAKLLKTIKDLQQVDRDLHARKATIAFYMSDKKLFKNHRFYLIQQHSFINYLEDLSADLKKEIYELKKKIEFISLDDEKVYQINDESDTYEHESDTYNEGIFF
jgi:hypothetical protein